MSITPVGTRTFSAHVAAEIKAWMGRLDVRQTELARRLGQNDTWLSTRLRGSTPIDLNELQRIADALEVKIVDLLPRESDGHTLRYDGPADQRHTVDVRRGSNTRPKLVSRSPARNAVPARASA